MEQPRVTIRDIAEELGLSTATVSNVIHGKTKKISDETVQRVQALLEEKQYIPSMAGILLAQNSSRIIGVVVNDHEKYEGRALEDFFVASSINHLSTQIEENGYFLMVKKTTDPEEILRFASMWNLEGLVLMGFCDGDYAYLRNHMRVPFVAYDGYCGNTERIYNITIDNFDGGFQVGRYFRESGQKNVLYIADNAVCVDKERFEGFRAGFGEGAERLIVPMHKAQRWEFYREKLPVLRSVSGVFAASDHYAIDLMQFLGEQGIRVPEEVSVVGFDDTPMCQLITPPLSSVSQNLARRAELAVQKLRELKEKKLEETSVTLPVTLVLRGSTKSRKQ